MVMLLRQKKTQGMVTRIIPPKIRLKKVVDTRQVYHGPGGQVQQYQDRQDEKLCRYNEKTQRDGNDNDHKNTTKNQDTTEEEKTLQITNVRRKHLPDGFGPEVDTKVFVHPDEAALPNTDESESKKVKFSLFNFMNSMSAMNDNICLTRIGRSSLLNVGDDDKKTMTDPDTQLLAYAAVQSDDGEIDVQRFVRSSSPILTKDPSSKWKISSAGSTTPTNVLTESSDRILLTLNDTRDVVPELDRDNTSIKSAETLDTVDGNDVFWLDSVCGPRSAPAGDGESEDIRTGQSNLSTHRSGIDTVSIATDEVSDFLSFLEDEIKKYSNVKRAKRENMSGRLIDVDDDGDMVSVASILGQPDPISSKPTFARIRTNGTNLRTHTLLLGRTDGKLSSIGRQQGEPNMVTVEKRITELESRLEAESIMNRELMDNLRSLRDEIRRLRDDTSSDNNTTERSDSEPESGSNNAIWKRMKMMKNISIRNLSKST